MNKRFWVYINGGAVKLTLKPGESLEHWTGGRHEEGWSSEWTMWVYDTENSQIVRQWCTDGRDCDGRLRQGGEEVAEFHKLRYVEPYAIDDPEVMWPGWRERDYTQYDEFAQQMGY